MTGGGGGEAQSRDSVPGLALDNKPSACDQKHLLPEPRSWAQMVAPWGADLRGRGFHPQWPSRWLQIGEWRASCQIGLRYREAGPIAAASSSPDAETAASLPSPVPFAAASLVRFWGPGVLGFWGCDLEGQELTLELPDFLQLSEVESWGSK